MAHGFGGHGKKERPVLPANVLYVYEPEKRFIYQRRRLKRAPRLLVLHIAVCLTNPGPCAGSSFAPDVIFSGLSSLRIEWPGIETLDG
jgi:hypothetical protein